MKNTQFHFRCKGNPKVIYTPEWMFDVEGMRKHPEYEEVDADGNLVSREASPEQMTQRIPMSVPLAAAKDDSKRAAKTRR